MLFKKSDDEDGLMMKSDDDDKQNTESHDDNRFNLESLPSGETMPAVRFQNVSVIGPTLTIKGELSADEDLVIEGEIEGTISHYKKHLTVGEQGRVKGNIHAHSVIVLGQLVGDIHSEGMVSLAKGADVKGNIFCARIAVEDGARWIGKIDMQEPSKVSAMPKEPMHAEAVRRGKTLPSERAKLN